MPVAVAFMEPGVAHSDWKGPAGGQLGHVMPRANARGRSVVWLGDQACEECALVGGKAANLCRLASEYRVPPGFCLTSAAFDRTVGWGFRGREENLNQREHRVPRRKDTKACIFLRFSAR